MAQSADNPGVEFYIINPRQKKSHCMTTDRTYWQFRGESRELHAAVISGGHCKNIVSIVRFTVRLAASRPGYSKSCADASTSPSIVVDQRHKRHQSGLGVMTFVDTSECIYTFMGV